MAKDLTSWVLPPLPRALLFLLVPLVLPRLLVQSGFFPALLLLHEMTSSTPADAAAVWQMRTSLQPHFRDGLLASADSDYHVVLVSLRALFNRAGLAAHFDAPGDVADLQLKASPFSRAAAQAQHLAKWTQDRVHLEALLLGVLKEFLSSSGDGRLAHLLNGVVGWDASLPCGCFRRRVSSVRTDFGWAS